MCRRPVKAFLKKLPGAYSQVRRDITVEEVRQG
jgi:hypothetical protein